MQPRAGVTIFPPNAEKPVVRLLAVDDDPQILALVTAALASENLQVHTTTDPYSALEMVQQVRPAIVLLDLMMPGLGGMELLEQMIGLDPGLDVVLLTGNYSPQAAVEAIQKGACDYLTKPISLSVLEGRISQLVSEAHRRHRTMMLDRELVDAYQFEGIVGRSPAMLEVFSRVRRIAKHFRTALITGPTGTGKELVASAIHHLSPVSNRRMVSYNCGAIVETLAESELFGHVKGAFTGATQDKEGCFEYANGGVLFLDEIAEMPLPIQAKLLRVLQQQEIQRVGSPVTRKVDVRIIAATHRNLRDMVDQKLFRGDLYYRLSMIELTLPPLSDRKEDLPLLCRYFLNRFNAQFGKSIRGLTRRAQGVLSKYSWPGNVRELENFLGHACMMADSELMDIRDLPDQLTLRSSQSNSEDEPLVSLDEAQRRYVQKVLRAVDGNKARAAEILGVSRATVYRLLSPESSEKASSAALQNRTA
jgi:DNA-binding NtrC family response regulator